MIHVRRYGRHGPPVIVLHGGPSAPGDVATLARDLSSDFQVFEPHQRASGEEALTVLRHVADLDEVVSSLDGPAPGFPQPVLVGHSWGAMLALAWAAAHPPRATALVLVGCGTFDPASREEMKRIREARMDDRLRRRLASLALEFPHPDERLKARRMLTGNLDDYDVSSGDGPAGDGSEAMRLDARAHDETWRDMVRLQEEGVYPAAFAKITIPVLMLHGTVDSHPGAMIRATLARYIPALEYHEWERCGHYPWRERHVREDFLATLRTWIRGRFEERTGRQGGPA